MIAIHNNILKYEAPAKINLMLNVKGKRPDGMHEVDMVMTSLTLHDTLTFRKRDDGKIVVHTDQNLGEVEDNLVFKAARKLQQMYMPSAGVEITLRKRIPVGAGLAGGSADCAATLRALVELWNLIISDAKLEEIAATLGADVPYCLYNKTAQVEGFGEKLTFLQPIDRMYVLLIKPPFSISTKEAYSDVSQDDALAEDEVKIFIENLEQRKKIKLRNSFETSAFRRHAILKQIKEQLLQFSEYVVLSGSGPTMYLLTKDKQVRDEAAKSFIKSDVEIIKTEIKNEKRN